MPITDAFMFYFKHEISFKETVGGSIPPQRTKGHPYAEKTSEAHLPTPVPYGNWSQENPKRCCRPLLHLFVIWRSKFLPSAFARRRGISVAIRSTRFGATERPWSSFPSRPV